MARKKRELSRAAQETLNRNLRHDRENRIAKKITWIVITIVVAVVSLIGLIIYNNIDYNLQPYNKNDTSNVQVVVEEGTTLKGLAQQLEDLHIIRNATLFNYFLKTKDIGSLQAGNYAMSPSMTLDQIVAVIKNGGADSPAIRSTVLVREGEDIDTIATTVGESTNISREEFLDAVQDESFISQLVATYPRLLTSMTQASGLRYKLEGYLFPATYDYHQNDSARTLIQDMVNKTDQVMSAYYDTIQSQNRTVQQVLTIASLAEREGVTLDDRRKIVSVFNNRLAINMPLQSDISVLYALGVHKEVVTLSDLEVDSPYNLYRNTGYGPGPFDSPSAEAIEATLNPDNTDYLYFVADTKTGTVYFARTLDEHNALVEQYVNNR